MNCYTPSIWHVSVLNLCVYIGASSCLGWEVSFWLCVWGQRNGLWGRLQPAKPDE